MPTAIENMIAYLTGYGLTSKEIPVEIAIYRAKEYAKRDGITVTELNERNSVDEVKKKSFRCHWVETQNYTRCEIQCAKCRMELE